MALLDGLLTPLGLAAPLAAIPLVLPYLVRSNRSASACSRPGFWATSVGEG